jgi:hypothetical protein
MPADARQKVERLPRVHRATPQEVAASTRVRAFFKAMAFHQARMFPRQRVSTRSLALHLARLLRDMTGEPFGCHREFPHVFVGVNLDTVVRRAVSRSFVGSGPLRLQTHGD